MSAPPSETTLLAPRTLALYEQRLNAHVLPRLGRKTRAADVKVQHLRRMIRRMRTKGLSGSTIRGTVAATSAIFRHAARDLDAIGRNPVRDLDLKDHPVREAQDRAALPLRDAGRGLARQHDRHVPAGGCRLLLGRPADQRGARAALARRRLRRLRDPRARHENGGVLEHDPDAARAGARTSLHREREARSGFARLSADALVFVTSRGAPRRAGTLCGRCRRRPPTRAS